MANQHSDRLRNEFVSEATTLVAQCTSDLLALTQASLPLPPSREGLWLDPELLYSLFRHGAELTALAGLMGVEELLHLLSGLEHLMDALRLGKIPLTTATLKLGFEAIDHCKRIISDVGECGLAAASPPRQSVDDFLRRVQRAAQGQHSARHAAPARAGSPPPQSGGRVKSTLVKVSRFTRAHASLPKMVELAGGTFLMGSPPSDKAQYDDEGPQRRVWVSEFSLGTVPVTQQLYQEVMELEQSPGFFQGQDLPVEQVSFLDAVRFCNKLSEQTGLTPCYRLEPEQAKWDRSANGYRLPTEAEWEYACRAGTETAYCFGDDAAAMDEYAWYDKNSGNQTHAVGQKRPNRWGLFDMHGNVLEWCWDLYDSYQVNPGHDSIKNPAGPLTGDKRVVRGGAFVFAARLGRAATRFRFRPTNCGRSLGFRYARGPLRQP